MRFLLCLIIPWLGFFTIGRPIAGVICLILQFTLIGWLPASIWAYLLSWSVQNRQKIEKMMKQQN
ncbi:YqaE/Pmp3 family membrane protein [Campylobacter sp.]|uniref:YqaE/Pmp3 family membrane protein n=1 Tax=Campylobacter sp. TaxID=205 RepID=UPI00259D0AC4|nr:YqaE/Pmp3 family membrane protein [Campylobacter sp.]MBQ7135262.1 YqaE/Pmp3 family membrane protein [Campylobacter sp.]